MTDDCTRSEQPRLFLKSLGVAALLFMVALGWLQHASRLPGSDADLVTAAVAASSPWAPRNLLLVGVDKVADGKRRSDTLIVARVDPGQRRVWLLSLPRDSDVGSISRNPVTPPEPAPACSMALVQARKRWPDRVSASDGVCASAQHNQANPTSDHRWGNAFDLTHDPEGGSDCARISEQLRRSRDARVSYVIFDRRYFSPRTGWLWRPYTGTEPHDKHMHVSVRPECRDDSSPWPGIAHDVRATPLLDLWAMITSPLRREGRSPSGIPPADSGGGREMKLNRAYLMGGRAVTIETVEEFLRMPIHGYVEVDLAGLESVIDALGGVWVDVPQEIDDLYASDTSPGSRARHIPAGRQLLDGEHAVTFARSRRRYANADLGRIHAQQLLLKGVATRIVTPAGIVRLPLVVSAIARSVSTDMSAPEMLLTLHSAALAGPGRLESRTLQGVWRSPYLKIDERAMRESVATMLGSSEFLPFPSEITLTIANGTSSAGLARTTAARLTAEGYLVKRVGNAPPARYPVTLIVAKAGSEKCARRVAVSLPFAKVMDAREFGYDVDTDVLIVLGEDAAKAFRKPAASTGSLGPDVSFNDWKERYRGHLLHGVRTNQRWVAITIDDGPNVRTDVVARTLERYGARGTFFWTGQLMSSEYRRKMTVLSRRGHEFANHTENHSTLSGHSYSYDWSQIQTTSAKIYCATGRRPNWVRPMGGGIDSTGMRAIARSRSLCVIWSIDSRDSHARYTSPGTLYRNVVDHVRPGDVILMHESHGETLQALPLICAELSRRGYKMVTLSQLAASGTPR